MRKILLSISLLSLVTSGLFAQENVNGDRYFMGKFVASTAAMTAPVRVVSSLPGTCNATNKERVVLSSNSTEYICSTTNTWTAVLMANLLGNPNGIATLDASSLIPKTQIPNLSSLNGTLNLSQINATGTPSSSTYLRGDNTWATITASGGGTTYTLPAATASTLGGVSIPSGYLSVTAGGALTAKVGNSANTLAAGNDTRFGQATSINGLNVTGTATDNYVLTYSNANHDIEWKAPTGGSSSSSSSTTSPVYFNLAYSSGTVNIGTDCTALNSPCKFRVGSISTTIASPFNVVPASGSVGTVLFYFQNGNITVGGTAPMNQATSTAGLTYASGVTNFPADSIPMYTCTVGGFAAGQFDNNGCTDNRAIYNTKNVTAAPAGGLVVTENTTSGASVLGVDTSLVGTRVFTAPATATTACSTGQWSFDSSYYYICVGTNTWKRMAISTF